MRDAGWLDQLCAEVQAAAVLIRAMDVISTGTGDTEKDQQTLDVMLRQIVMRAEVAIDQCIDLNTAELATEAKHV
jgi:uncharacterized SAM-dependent methyltransferase